MSERILEGMGDKPVREIELAAREYLRETACAAFHERMAYDPITEIRERIRAQIRQAGVERLALLGRIAKFERIVGRVVKKSEGENFLRDVVQRKLDEMRMNALQIQLMEAKMHIALEMLADYEYAPEVLAIGEERRQLLPERYPPLRLPKP